jgi:Domain of unknown function (DUF5753)
VDDFGVLVCPAEFGSAGQEHPAEPAHRPQFELLLAEPVLRWLPCPTEVIRAQLDRLQTVIGLPNARLGVVPLGGQLDTMPQNSFVLYDDV